jgi:hypothetical protein
VAVDQAGSREHDEYGESNQTPSRLMHVFRQSCHFEFMLYRSF